MRDLSPADRPREKLSRHGAGALGDNELLALVLGTGSGSTDALGLANRTLATCGGLRGLARSSLDDFVRIAGIGLVKAARLRAAVELGRRTLTSTPGERVQFRTPGDAAAFLLPAFGAHPVEQFGAVLLDTKHFVLRTVIIAVGTLNATIVQPRDVFREALVVGAAAVIVFHNHPSGDPSPSPEDVALTRRLTAAGVLLGVDLVDHVVLGDVKYCSLRETGRL